MHECYSALSCMGAIVVILSNCGDTVPQSVGRWAEWKKVWVKQRKEPQSEVKIITIVLSPKSKSWSKKGPIFPLRWFFYAPRWWHCQMGRRCPLEGRKAQHQLIKVFQQSGETSCYVQDDIDFLTCVLTLKTHAAEATLYVTVWTLQCLLTLLSRCRQAANSRLCIFFHHMPKKELQLRLWRLLLIPTTQHMADHVWQTSLTMTDCLFFN